MHVQFYKVTKLQHPAAVAYCCCPFAADIVPIISHFNIAVLIICCKLNVELLLLMQCYKPATLQQLTVAAWCNCPFSAYFIPVVSYFLAAFSICYVASVEYICCTCSAAWLLKYSIKQHLNNPVVKRSTG